MNSEASARARNSRVDGQHTVDEATDPVPGSGRRVVHLLVEIVLVVVLPGLVDQFGVGQQGVPSRYVVMSQVSPLDLLAGKIGHAKRLGSVDASRPRGHPNAGEMTSFSRNETSAGAA
jgi:hypothetical protein